MMPIHLRSRWFRVTALFCVGLCLHFLLAFMLSCLFVDETMAQKKPDASTTNSCAVITSPLTADEQVYARAAWQYFAKNYIPSTGFANATGGYPATTLWDIGNYLVALNTARWLNLIPQKEFDEKLNKFLTSFSNLKLFEDTLPNKVYNAATGKMTDYGNKPTDRGIGWSALDIGRVLAAFHIIRTCHPQYADWLKGTIAKWQVERSLKDGQLYGATVLPNGKTLLVQEGRLGYEEYAARGYELWGFKAPKALSLQPFSFVDIYGVQIPADLRDYQATNANNYVVSESYILDGIEFGLKGELADYAGRVLEVQRRRYQNTGQITAVTEDNIDSAPYFIYNTVYSNGVPWAAITDDNKPIPQFRSVSTKAAFGWRYLYPTNEYAKKAFDVVKGLRSPKDDGYFAGLYEATKKPNTSLTGNTNGLILEILYYKARGNRPLTEQGASTVAAAVPAAIPPVTADPPSHAAPAAIPPVVIIAPANTIPETIPHAASATLGKCPQLSKPLSITERRYARAAWQYFRASSQASGLINDRSDFKGTSMWGLGDYLSALRAARGLGIVSELDFDQRVRQLFGTIAQLTLVGGELPNRGYDPWSLQPVDYGGNPVEGGTGWSAADLGHLISSLYGLKTCYPDYTEAVDRLLLDWSYLRVVRDGALMSGTVSRDSNGRTLTRVNPEQRLGYEEYAARAFQLWGFDLERSAVGGQYKTASVEGETVPLQRERKISAANQKQYTVVDPFLVYGLEFGFDPQMRSLFLPILKAQAERYQHTNTLTGAGTVLTLQSPYIVHSTVVGQGEPWAALGDDGKAAPNGRIVSTAAAFAMHALFPDLPYTQDLWQASTDLYNPQLGYYEGFYEEKGNPENNFTSETNSIVLQSLLYQATNQQPLIRPNDANDSPWWKAVAAEDSGHGLPTRAEQPIKFVTDSAGSYWISLSAVNNAASQPATPPSPATAPKPEGNNTSTDTKPAVDPAIAELSTQPSATTTAPPPQPRVPKPQPADLAVAKTAWQYFERNWNPQTGMVNAVDRYAWTTMWDQGSAILGTHAARQLGIISPEVFQQRMNKLLNTLGNLPIPKTKLPNKAYSTSTAQMRQLDDTPDPNGISGWSALDTARFLMSLHVLRVHYPEYSDRINRIVSRWQLSQLTKDGWLYGGFPNGKKGLQLLQEGRLGYEQYAAQCLKLWNVEAKNALDNPPVQTVRIDDIPVQVDRRDRRTSGASNYLTSDPYILWGLEVGWNDRVKPQVENLYKLQAQRFDRTKIITAVNEDSINRPPYFLYYCFYANGQPWNAVNSRGQSFPNLKFTSTKAAFAWSVLMPQASYSQKLRDAVQNLADPNRGYFSGIYENPQLGKNTAIDVNTNAIILESMLYKSLDNHPLLS
jgi:hypothetical protein